MKLVSYRTKTGIDYGVVAGDGVVPISATLRRKYPSVYKAIRGKGLKEIASWAKGKKPSLPLKKIKYAPPLWDADKVICIGVNYPKRHPVHGEMPPPENISLFIKLPSVIVGNGENLEQPKGEAAKTMDYEGELVLVIGKGGRHIQPKDALKHIGGYTILNDGSVRGWQKHSVGAGKNFHRMSASGPWFVTSDEIKDPFGMELKTRLNGELVQNSKAGDMIFGIPELISYVSGMLPLEPGDMISTGSPEGSGGSRQPQRFLIAGDELEIEWSGIGTLRNKVVPAK
ncbi:MAG: fumarylacetoacetate hydrolase family protein [Proteobacteria bacterium]|nr:fumarylacetoacetate hydrolase family protein [Pseudomonadota bacterium]